MREKLCHILGLPSHQNSKDFNNTFNTVFDAMDVEGGGDLTLDEMMGFVGANNPSVNLPFKEP